MPKCQKCIQGNKTRYDYYCADLRSIGSRQSGRLFDWPLILVCVCVFFDTSCQEGRTQTDCGAWTPTGSHEASVSSPALETITSPWATTSRTGNRRQIWLLMRRYIKNCSTVQMSFGCSFGTKVSYITKKQGKTIPTWLLHVLVYMCGPSQQLLFPHLLHYSSNPCKVWSITGRTQLLIHVSIAQLDKHWELFAQLFQPIT